MNKQINNEKDLLFYIRKYVRIVKPFYKKYGYLINGEYFFESELSFSIKIRNINSINFTYCLNDVCFDLGGRNIGCYSHVNVHADGTIIPIISSCYPTISIYHIFDYKDIVTNWLNHCNETADSINDFSRSDSILIIYEFSNYIKSIRKLSQAIIKKLEKCFAENGTIPFLQNDDIFNYHTRTVDSTSINYFIQLIVNRLISQMMEA